MEIKGKVAFIGEKQTISDKFAKREFVLETAEQYPQLILIQATNERCGILDKLTLGQDVTASINLRGRKWTDKDGNDKYFNTIEAWKINFGSDKPALEIKDSPFREDYANSLEQEQGELPF
jgi:hypothetical protein